MPIYLDRHYVEGATRNTLALAHEKDLEIQDEFNVKFLTYWFDEARSTAFCLVEAPDKSAVEKTHDAAHGDIPGEILEVDPAIVQSFLGRIADPESTSNQAAPVDSAFRGIMFTDLKDSTLMTTIYGDEKSLHLLHIHNSLCRNAFRHYGGREVKHTGDGFMVSFDDIGQMLACAKDIQYAFSDYNNKCSADESLQVRIGLSAGEPIEEHGDLFGSAVQKAARLCSIASPGKVLASQEVYELETDPQAFSGSEKVVAKGFDGGLQAYSLNLTS